MSKLARLKLDSLPSPTQTPQTLFFLVFLDERMMRTRLKDTMTCHKYIGLVVELTTV